MKKLVFLIWVIALAVTMVSCQNRDKTTTDSRSSDTMPPSTGTTAPFHTTAVTTSAEATVETTPEMTYEDVVYDTSPIIGEAGEPLRVHWNPYLFSPLVTDGDRAAFEKAAWAILNQRGSVTFDSEERASLVLDNLFYEFPPSALCELTREGATLRFAYRYEREEHLSKIEAFGKEVEEILKDYLVFEDGDAEKAILLYHAVSYTVDYYKVDYKPWQTNAFTALIDKKGICYSFVDAYNYLLRQVGVEAWLVKGYRKSDKAAHGWSLIKVGDDYYHCDPTWEYNNCDGVGFNYFAMTDDRRASAVALEAATLGEGALKTAYRFTANGSRFQAISGDKFRSLSWTIDREKQAILYKGKEYSYAE